MDRSRHNHRRVEMRINKSKLNSAVTKAKYFLKEMNSEIEPEYQIVVQGKDEVLRKFQPIFDINHLPSLTREEFCEFLIFRNNKHWNGLQRIGSRITEDMALLRNALSILLDESQDIKDRLNKILPQDGAMVPWFGRATITPILLVKYPDKYGVLNNVSESGLRALEIWPNFSNTALFSEQYIEINEILRYLAENLEIDLWTLDMLWWKITSSTEGGTIDLDFSEKILELNEDLFAFSMERHLQDFLVANWAHIKEIKDWEIFTSHNEPFVEKDTNSVGRIDILAKHKDQPRWLVIELKRNQTSDQTVGQVLRYMGWVRNNLAKKDETVEGLIICRSVDEGLRSALTVISSVKVWQYEVDFHLKQIQVFI